MLQSLANSKKNFDNYAEIQDKDNLLKTICRKCGGKREYLQQWMDGKTMKIVKKEVVKCEHCEEGFKYGFNNN